uniref:ERAP1-like C-terminal domain-containing protein n=1 Tax=Timema shepardi TaxID=629360 RepID=A0A7R9B6Z9_TIMSH|nr:unnamed protein product [Timema shepardi]
MTHFQPTYARQAFPCFDQPNFKSKFLVKLVRPSEGYSALSNMNQVKEIPDSPKTGLTTVEFQESILMPTYLLCFVINKWGFLLYKYFYLKEVTESFVKADSTAKKSKKYDDYRWDVPITYITGSNNEVHRAWFMSDMESLSIDCPASEPWVKFNYRQIGYYRVNYDPTEWKKLSDVLYTDENVFKPSDRAHLLEDAFKLADSGLLDYETPLELSQFLEKETHFVPWATAYNIFSFLHDMLNHSKTYPKLRKYFTNLVKKAYDDLGWEVKDNDSYLRKRARSIVLRLACEFGHQECLKEVGQRFSAWILSPEERLHPDIRDIIY